MLPAYPAVRRLAGTEVRGADPDHGVEMIVVVETVDRSDLPECSELARPHIRRPGRGLEFRAYFRELQAVEQQVRKNATSTNADPVRLSTRAPYQEIEYWSAPARFNAMSRQKAVNVKANARSRFELVGTERTSAAPASARRKTPTPTPLVLSGERSVPWMSCGSAALSPRPTASDATTTRAPATPRTRTRRGCADPVRSLRIAAYASAMSAMRPSQKT